MGADILRDIYIYIYIYIYREREREMNTPHGHWWNILGKIRRQLHKTATNNTEKILEAISQKTTAVRPPTSHLSNNQITTDKICVTLLRDKNELIIDILPWTPSHRRANVGRSTRTYLQQLCTHTGCSLEYVLEAMEDRDDLQERVWEI